MRGRGVDALDDALDLLQLLHQVRLAVQAAGGVCQQHVELPRACRLQRIEHHGSGIRARLLCGELGAGPLRPDVELFDRGRAKGIACREHQTASLLGEIACELADAGCLARAVDADDEDDEGLACRVDGQRNGTGGEDVRDGRPQGCYQCRNVGELVACHPPLQVREDLLRRLDADVRHQQTALELVEDFGVDLAAAEQVRQIVGQPRRATVELAAQPVEETALRGLRRDEGGDRFAFEEHRHSAGVAIVAAPAGVRPGAL